MLKASALFYALLLTTLIALFCASLVWSYQYFSSIESVLFEQSKKKYEGYHAFLKGIYDYPLKAPNLSYNQWGFIQTIQTAVVYKKDTFYKNGMIGQRTTKNIALYYQNNQHPLQQEGNSYIHGEIFLNDFSIKKGFKFNSQNRASIINSPTTIKNFTLPSVQEFILPNQYHKILINQINPFHYYNPFYKKTTLIDCSNTNFLSNLNLSGNIILFANKPIYIDHTCKFNNLIIHAPSVYFGQNFKGSCQVYAHENIIVDKNCTFQYPSCLYIKSALNAKIDFGLNCLLYGAIILNNTNINSYVKLNNKSIVFGEVYSNQNIEHYGSIYGAVYTTNFMVHQQNTSYNNYLLDGIIDATKNIKNSIYFNIFNQQSNTNYELIQNI